MQKRLPTEYPKRRCRHRRKFGLSAKARRPIQVRSKGFDPQTLKTSCFLLLAVGTIPLVVLETVTLAQNASRKETPRHAPGRSRTLRFHPPHGVADERGGILQSQLFFDVAAVHVDGF